MCLVFTAGACRLPPLDCAEGWLSRNCGSMPGRVGACAPFSQQKRALRPHSTVWSRPGLPLGCGCSGLALGPTPRARGSAARASSAAGAWLGADAHRPCRGRPPADLTLSILGMSRVAGASCGRNPVGRLPSSPARSAGIQATPDCPLPCCAQDPDGVRVPPPALRAGPRRVRVPSPALRAGPRRVRVSSRRGQSVLSTGSECPLDGRGEGTEGGEGQRGRVWRAMTRRWIWLVPSKIWVTLASRK